MGNGYTPGRLSDEDGWRALFQSIQQRLAELERPTGTSINSLVAQVQEAIANINTTVNAAIATNSYTKTQIDSKIASPGAIAPTDVTASGNVSVGGTTTATGDIFTPNATAAVSGYTICYLNSDGRVSKGASSARYKVSISPVDPASLGDLFPPLQTYEMVGDAEHTSHVGYVAEHLAGNPDQERFVVWQYDGDLPAVDAKGALIPESIDFIALLLAQTSQLNQRLKRAGF